jgi:hypothetical protein
MINHWQLQKPYPESLNVALEAADDLLLGPALGDGLWVGAHDRVAALANPRALPAESVHRRLAQLLEGEEIIAYGLGHPGLRRFTRAQRARLNQLEPLR